MELGGRTLVVGARQRQGGGASFEIVHRPTAALRKATGGFTRGSKHVRYKIIIGKKEKKKKKMGFPKVPLQTLSQNSVRRRFLPQGGEVFYTPDGIAFSEGEPITWGTPFCFPQFGAGGERAGTPTGRAHGVVSVHIATITYARLPSLHSSVFVKAFHPTRTT